MRISTGYGLQQLWTGHADRRSSIEPEPYAAETLRTLRKPPESLDAWECVIRALSALSQ